MPRSSEHAQAEAAARRRQSEANQPRRDQDALELDLCTTFEVARRHKDDASEKVANAELEMGDAIVGLLAMGNSPDRVAILTGLDDHEFKRLRKVAESASSARVPPPSRPAPQPLAGPTERPSSSTSRNATSADMEPASGQRMQPDSA